MMTLIIATAYFDSTFFTCLSGMKNHQMNWIILNPANTPQAPAEEDASSIARETKAPSKTDKPPAIRMSREGVYLKANSKGSLNISTHVVVRTTVVFMGLAIRYGYR